MKNSIQNLRDVFSALQHFKLYDLWKNSYSILILSLKLRLCVVAAFSFMLFTGCESDSGDLLLEEEKSIEVSSGISGTKAETAAISDGAHGGMEGFYFLPPMVTSPAYSGTFNASLSPIIEIYDKSDNSLHATYSMEEGTGSELVRLDEEGQHYIVNWHTDQTGTVVGKTYNLRIRVAGTILGHADVQMAENGKEAKNLTNNAAIALVDGKTLPIKFRIEEGAVHVVGPEGGAFSAVYKQVSLVIPPNSLNEQIGITINPVEDELNDPDVVPGAIFDFGPSPYSFNEEVILTIKYDPANLPAGVPEDELRLLAVVNGEWVQLPGSSVDVLNSTVTGPLNSFSRKGVGRGKVHEVAVVPADASIDVGETVQFEAVLTNVDNEVMSRNVQWSSSDEDIATVDNSGLATAVAFGEATIEAKVGKISEIATLTVENTSIEIIAETITSGENHSCGLTSNGVAYCWGINTNGQLGNGSNTDSDIPVRVKVPTGLSFVSINAAQKNTVALTPEGVAYSWGNNEWGQLGDGSDMDSNEPVAVQTETRFVAISSGRDHTMALSSEGLTYTWGRNNHGQLGNGTTTNSYTPVVSNLPVDVKITAIGAGLWHNVVLTESGDVYAWGYNRFGSVGDGSNDNRSSPVQVRIPDGVYFTSISAGGFYNMALTATGEAYGWGSNSWYALGDGTNQDRNTPQQVRMPQGVSFAKISASYYHTLAITTTGDAYAWGTGSHGVLGVGPYNSINYGREAEPVAVLMPPGVSFISISAGLQHSLALSATGVAYSWGRNQYGQLGQGIIDLETVEPGLVYGAIIFGQ